MTERYGDDLRRISAERLTRVWENVGRLLGGPQRRSELAVPKRASSLETSAELAAYDSYAMVRPKRFVTSPSEAQELLAELSNQPYLVLDLAHNTGFSMSAVDEIVHSFLRREQAQKIFLITRDLQEGRASEEIVNYQRRINAFRMAAEIRSGGRTDLIGVLTAQHNHTGLEDQHPTIQSIRAELNDDLRRDIIR